MGQMLDAVAWESDENTPNFVGSIETAAEYLRELAEPRPAGDPVKAAIDRAAKRAGFTYTRTFDLWYRKARRIEQFEQDAIAAALLKRRREVARNEFHELRTRLSRLESLLAQSDPDFHADAIRHVRTQLASK